MTNFLASALATLLFVFFVLIALALGFTFWLPKPQPKPPRRWPRWPAPQPIRTTGDEALRLRLRALRDELWHLNYIPESQLVDSWLSNNLTSDSDSDSRFVATCAGCHDTIDIDSSNLYCADCYEGHDLDLPSCTLCNTDIEPTDVAYCQDCFPSKGNEE